MEWISVKDEMPENHDTVLTYGNPSDGGFYINHCTHSDGIFRFWDSDKENKGTVTHWMPLPKPPTK